MPVTRRRLLSAAFLCLMAAVIAFRLRPVPSLYTITDLGVLPGATLSSASGINNSGDVVGLSGSQRRDMQHAFLYHNGVLIDLCQFGLINSQDGPAINASGQITGVMDIVYPPRRKFHAFLYDEGRLHDQGMPPGCSISMGNGINRYGQIVGVAFGTKSSAFVESAFLRRGSQMVSLASLPGYQNSQAASINAGGQIAGWCRQGNHQHAFVCDSRIRRMTALATPGRYTDSVACGINDAGEVVGTVSDEPNWEHAAVWIGGKLSDLGTPPGMDSANGAAINNLGVAVGTAWSQPSKLSGFVNDHPIRFRLLLPVTQQRIVNHAFVYRASCMTDLNALIPAHSGWILEEARSINDAGQIVGQGLHHGQERAFLLTPVR